MTVKTSSFRSKLLIGASIGSILLAGVAEAQSGRGRGGASVDPADAAIRAAQEQAQRQAQSNVASQRAIQSFRRAAEGRAAMQQAQAAARAAARAAQNNVPNGLGQGGLQVANGVTLDPSLWVGANGPAQVTGADGRTVVTVGQTESKAILTWDSFNVGRETDLVFNQQGNADWVALNRVNAGTDPTRILGNIKADGSVYIINRNGIIFGGASQVNTRNLIASTADIATDQFLNRGIYSQLSGADYVPVFTGAGGVVTVEAGAQITTHSPKSVTAGGGFVLLMGTEVTNAGSITTPRGQTALVAGDDFIIRRGYGTTENPFSTTRGNEVRGLINADSTSGTVINAGQIEAAQGDITLSGRTIRQDGVLLSTTSVNQRGTIHLLNSASDTEGSVTLGKDSLTLILPELESKDTALNSQRDALIAESEKANLARASTVTGGFDDRSLQADRLDQSRVEIVTGGNVVFESGSQTMANGGQVAVQANAGRITIKDGSNIDVSGIMGVALDMASNSIRVNVQGNELRDSPSNREEAYLKNQNIWVDVRDLVLLPSGTGGYEGDRWYTPGGLLEVGGYLGTTAHSIGEWTAVGGTITLAANEVVAEKGAVFDISGGSIDYASGYVRSSLVMGADGRMYDLRNAPANMKFVGVGNAFMVKHDRWGSQYSEVYSNRLFGRGTTMRWEDGYTVGRDAGKLILSAPTAIMEAEILAGVINGERQIIARPTDVADGYALSQHTVAKAGMLALGGYDHLGRTILHDTDVRIGAIADITQDVGVAAVLPAERSGTAWFDADRLSAHGLGGIEIGTLGAVSISGDLTLADGGSLDITAPKLDITGTVTIRGGTINATNRFVSTLAGAQPGFLTLVGDGTGIMLGADARLDVRGQWANGWNAPDGLAMLGHIDGGAVSLQSTHDVVLANGSVIDASSGGAIMSDGTFMGGRGGDVTLAGGVEGGSADGSLVMDGIVRGYGAAGGGTLLLQADRVRIGASEAATDTDTTLVLDQDFFDKGFGNYEIVGNRGIAVSDGATVDVTMPAYRQATGALSLAAGSDPAQGMELWTPPLYEEDPLAGVLHQRGGASLTLRTGTVAETPIAADAIDLTIGLGATVSVDPGQRLALAAPNQLTVLGRLNAWGGTIDIRQSGLSIRDASGPQPLQPGVYSTWIGEDAVLDVAARAATAVDRQGRRYGLVADGGSIRIGGSIDHATGDLRADGNFIVLREGALLDASGVQAVLDPGDRRDVAVASNGGAISLASLAGLYLHGDMKAGAGGTGAAGGTLELALGTVFISASNPRPEDVRVRELIVSQDRSDPDNFGADTPRDAADRLYTGHGAVAVEQIQEGGFANLALGVGGQISFGGDVDLTLGQSARFYAKSLALAEVADDDSRISITTPYLLLAGARPLETEQPGLVEASVGGSSARETEAILTLNAGLIDMRDVLGIGAGGTLPPPNGALVYDRRGFADVQLVSSGDIRFLMATGINTATRFNTANALTMTAAQLYPTTHARAEITAHTIRIGRSTVDAPALPYSVFGQLSLFGDFVQQGGVVRAPLGIVTLGTTNAIRSPIPGGSGELFNRGSTEVNLLPGSITSVSANGLVMPYGGTVDGVTYSYAGDLLSDTLLGRQPVRSGVTLAGQSIDVADGAVIDLSGGGTLTGAGFISGRGGSVDVLRTALADANPGYAASVSGSGVYALVPSFNGASAPLSPDAGAGDPMVGQQITLDAGVAGLPAGTYTLMPSTYALLPGAFRVEIANAADPRGIATGAVALDNGSHTVTGHLGIAGTNIREALTRQVIVTPGKLVRNYSLYNETGLADFAMADAARLGVPRVRLSLDVKQLSLNFAERLTDRDAFSFSGDLLNTPAKDGWGGEVFLTPGVRGKLEIVAAGQSATEGFDGVTLTDRDVNALNAGRLLIGGETQILYGQSGNFVDFVSMTNTVAVRSGANISASDIFLVAGEHAGAIIVEQGAVLNTLGKGTVGQDSRDGYIYVPGRHSILAVSNGYVNLLAPAPNDSDFGPTRIDIGGCETLCTGATALYSEGTIVAVTDKAFTLDDSVRFGTRNLTLAVGGVNVGSEAAIADAAANGALPAGLELNQSVLDRLLRGDTSTGAPALETLVLNARESINFFGTVTLDTIDPATGKSLLANLVLTTGGIYGRGSASDVATIRTANLIWNGNTNAAPTVMAGGAGTGNGALNIEADRIEFGFGPDAVTANAVHDRLALGFAAVNLTASDRITANHNGTLAVYQAQGAYTASSGFAYSGGDLTITAPLITGSAGSINKIVAGGAVLLSGAGTPSAVTDLGGELSIRGDTLTVETAIILPSGKLTLGAVGDLVLGDAAGIDVAGREVPFDDVKKYSWGGEVVLESRDGNIRQTAASVIDLSAQYNNAGVLRATALNGAAGLIDLQGRILGSASGEYDAGGTIVPYRAGMVDLRAQSLGDFAALNTRLNDGGVFGARAFQIKQGDLTVGNEVRAGDVAISLDGGHLTIMGKVDASGAQVGRIRLAGADGLTLTGTAALDAHGERLRVDSYGKIIDSPNRAIVELGSGTGTLILEAGARIDLRHGTNAATGTGTGQNDGRARGTLELNAPRVGTDDVAIDASGALSIDGARLIAVNAVRRYGDADVADGTETTADGRPYKVIDQAWMDDRHAENTAFMDAALGNGALMSGKLAELNTAAYRDAFHLRPAVEVATTGDLVVSGDLDLSGYRYASVNPNTPLTALYGSGEVGTLTLRAGGDLSIYGSINDGFAPPPDNMPEAEGWVLLPGIQMFNADVIMPRSGVQLQEGTTFRSGGTLNYDVPIQGMEMAAGTRLPVAGELTADVILPADTVLSGNIRNSDGSIAYAAGTRLAENTTLQAGMTLDAGTLLAVATPLAAMIWTKGVPLPRRARESLNDGNPDIVRLSATVTLPIGGLIPAGADLQLGAGVEKINLRPGDGTGKSWALAQMLPEGSQSWSMRLVAGADLGAANNLLTDPNATHGRLVLADLHYGMTGKAVTTGGGRIFTEEGAANWLGDMSFAGLTESELTERLLNEYGLTPEEAFGVSFSDLCAMDPTACAGGDGPVILTEEGANYFLGDPSFAGLTEAELEARLMAEYGLTIEMTFGLSFADACAIVPDACGIGGGTTTIVYTPNTTTLSVLRTGTGDLDLASAGDLSVQSLYGVYTAGTSSLTLAESRAAGLDMPRGTVSGTNILPGAGFEQYVNGGDQSLYRAWYPDHGGNLGVTVGGDLTGDIYGYGPKFISSDVSNWLWRQSSAQGTGAPTAWWINFGTYAPNEGTSGLSGFTGFGTLGGGDLDVRVSGDAGMLQWRGGNINGNPGAATRSQGLVLAVGSTGRVIDGELIQTGGGDIDVRISGGLNPALEARAFYDGGSYRLISDRLDLVGAVVNLRGTVGLDAGSIGGIETIMGGDRGYQDPKETRAYDPFVPTMASATGGLLLAPGDATVRLNTRGDLVLGNVLDPTRTPQRNYGAYQFGTMSGTGEAAGWFSLWTDRTAIDLFSAGGDMTPITALGNTDDGGNFISTEAASQTDARYVYPSIFRAVAASGNVFAGPSGVYDGRGGNKSRTDFSLILAPGNNGRLEVLAADSIYAGGYAITPSGADMSTLVTPFNPGFAVYGFADGYFHFIGIGLDNGFIQPRPNYLFGFGPNTVVGGNPGAAEPARFYARDGDVVGLRTGEILSFDIRGVTLYEGARPVWIKAGRDIVNSGTNLNAPTLLPSEMGSGFNYSSGNLFVHNNETDVSIVSAGRDIIFSSFAVAGPGTLEVTAGRNIQMEDRASVTSIGGIVLGDTRPGASIAMMAGGTGMDFAAIRTRYLDPANLADPERPLADAQNAGKAVKIYGEELGEWLQDRYSFTGSGEAALAYFDALAPEQQRVFLRQVYYAELREGGREYNEVDSPRFGSYLRGRDMIATLAPDKDATGATIIHTGDILMYGGSGVRTNVGGDIQMLVPGGQIVVGVQGEVPPSTAGLVTQGAGDIQLFSEGSLLMGLSRIMTTFGGDIFAWSEKGDINAGRGSKSTIVYTSPRRTYDAYGNIALAPQVPSTGAGIATLNPIPEVAPGDVDLIAPLGVIDAGEAGIRVSGNVNLAALQVLNAANIQVQGDAKGIPLPPVVNTGALTAASSATSSVVAEATRLAERARPPIRTDIPMLVTVTFVGFGEP